MTQVRKTSNHLNGFFSNFKNRRNS